jgi:LysR family transcriptional regulator, glycine cleavage system transcriptional activator
MGRRLPSLTGLRAFEAAARHLSFTRAASELHVTQTAISHQIRALEEALGLKLFRRLPRGLVLTEEAQLFLPPVRDAFDAIAAATERLKSERTGALTVSVTPSFAAKWLVPRLARLRLAQPELDLRISATPQLADFARDEVDVAIRVGRGGYAGLRVDRLFGDSLFPVCSPALLEGPAPLRVPDDLRHHVLLAGDEEPGWATWLEHAGAQGVEPPRGPLVDDSAMVLQAAIEGQGVALTRSVLAAADLAAGRLVRPFALALPFELAYWLVCPEARAEQPRIRAFREWILAEAAAQEGPQS